MRIVILPTLCNVDVTLPISCDVDVTSPISCNVGLPTVIWDSNEFLVGFVTTVQARKFLGNFTEISVEKMWDFIFMFFVNKSLSGTETMARSFFLCSALNPLVFDPDC